MKEIELPGRKKKKKIHALLCFLQNHIFFQTKTPCNRPDALLQQYRWTAHGLKRGRYLTAVPCQGERRDFLKWVNLDFSFLSAGEALTGCLLRGAGRWIMVVIWWKSTISHAWCTEKNKAGQKSEKTWSMNCKMQKQRGCFPVNSPRG